jgi:hypothetical protein
MTAASKSSTYRYYIRCAETRVWDEVTEWDYAAMRQALRELPSFFDGVQIARQRVTSAAPEPASGPASKAGLG